MSSTAIERQVCSLSDSSIWLGGVSVYSLRRHIAAGAISAINIGGRVFIPVSELQRVAQFGVGKPRARRTRGNGK